MSLTIWHLLSNRWNSAITEYALSAARAWELKGHTSVFTPLAGSPAERRAAGYGLRCEPLARFNMAQIPELRRAARAIRPDLVMVYGGPETFLARFLPDSETEPAAPIVRFRGQELSRRQRGSPRLFRMGHSHCTAIITPGTILTTAVRAMTSDLRVETVSLGLDTRLFHKVRGVDPFASQRPELMMVGRFDPIKGHAFLIEVFAELLASWEPLPWDERPRLHLVGEPANLSRVDLAGLVRAHGLKLGSDVLLTCERVDNLAELMTRASLGVVASLGSESICRVAEEFLLCGTPLLVSGVGELADVLFKNAGESYAGKGKVEVVAQLKNLVRASRAETDLSRELRASMAKSLFSLQSMGRQLTRVCLEPEG